MADKPDVERVEDDAWLVPSPIFVDDFSFAILKSSQIVRIAFAEWVERDRPRIYRVGIAMPVKDAKALIRSLGRAIREMESVALKEDGPDK